MSTELKDQIRGELIKQKEEKLQKEIELNKKLKEITLYCIPNNPVCKSYIDFYTTNGVKFNEKDINLYPEVHTAVQTKQVPVILVNDEYLVHAREFPGAAQSIGALRHFANPDYVNVSNDIYIKESIKNIRFQFVKQFQQINRSLQPIIKVMSDLQKEITAEQAPNKSKQPNIPSKVKKNEQKDN